MASDETGTAAVLQPDGSIDLREYPVVSPGDRGIMTEVVLANVCGSDVHGWEGGGETERVLGHEVLCRVSELGAAVETDSAGRPLEEGDLVVPAHYNVCRHCTYCNEGYFHLCENKYEHIWKPPEEPPHFHGTFATHFHVPDGHYVYKVPGDLPRGALAAANCAIPTVLFGLDRVDVGHEDTVVVQGAGGLGLTAVAAARERGARTIVIEGASRRVERAREFGADDVIDATEVDTVEARRTRVRELTDGLGADVAVEVAGVAAAFDEGVGLLRGRGRYVEIGNVVSETTEFDPSRLVGPSITVVGSALHDPWYVEKAVEFVADTVDTYPYESLTDAEFPLSEVKTALERSADRDVTRASIVP